MIASPLIIFLTGQYSINSIGYKNNINICIYTINYNINFFFKYMLD